MGNKSVSLPLNLYEKRKTGEKQAMYQDDRRKTSPADTTFYKVMVTLNILAWLGLVAVLILFHYARPDFISGVQKYWGVEGVTTWSQDYIDAMIILLRVCLGLSLVSLIMKAKRSRRQNDSFGVNLIVLTIIVAVSLFTLATTVG
ncbi:hypothetical protein [Alteromonas hispanica]|uniref:Uncharacterized protein n=1 Tax=Alteromonas hispanica TaxID=315421 RepID=A0A6L9MRW0_9ALTE|nr:hypothetical protein [Alteromonas hispanica]NDW20908.1 hypothetical protein [Alteromonas hispanica]